MKRTFIFIGCCLFFLASSCYRMPEEGEVSVLPITNNPSITHPGENGVIPGISLPGVGI